MVELTYKEALAQAIANVEPYKSAVAKFCIIKKGNSVHDVWNTACSAGLRDWHGKDAKRIVSRICFGCNSRPLKQDVLERYFDWLINHSPYKTAFIRCSGKVAVKRGYTILRCDRDGNLVGSAATAARMCTEHYGQVAFLWDRLVANDIHPNVAFLMTHFIQSNDHKYVNFGSPADGYWGWHSCIDGKLINRNYIFNFRMGTPERKCGNYSEVGRYKVMCSMWDDGEKDLQFPSLFDEVKTAITNILNECHKEKPKEDRKINPFANPEDKPKKKFNMRGDLIAPVNDFIPLYAKWIKENI